jgi:hypothetical protein
MHLLVQPQRHESHSQRSTFSCSGVQVQLAWARQRASSRRTWSRPHVQHTMRLLYHRLRHSPSSVLSFVRSDVSFRRMTHEFASWRRAAAAKIAQAREAMRVCASSRDGFRTFFQQAREAAHIARKQHVRAAMRGLSTRRARWGARLQALSSEGQVRVQRALRSLAAAASRSLVHSVRNADCLMRGASAEDVRRAASGGDAGACQQPACSQAGCSLGSRTE